MPSRLSQLWLRLLTRKPRPAHRDDGIPEPGHATTHLMPAVQHMDTRTAEIPRWAAPVAPTNVGGHYSGDVPTAVWPQVDNDERTAEAVHVLGLPDDSADGVWAEPEPDPDSAADEAEPPTRPDRCPHCGPSYRYGDDGCRHTPTTEPAGTLYHSTNALDLSGEPVPLYADAIRASLDSGDLTPDVIRDQFTETGLIILADYERAILAAETAKAEPKPRKKTAPRKASPKADGQ